MALTDPYLWLEEVESERALEWVRAQNDRTVAKLERHPLYQTMFDDAKAILLAKDRVPFSNFGFGHFWNFWQDETYTHGILRRTTYEEYLGAAPEWETILDLDELSKREGENWVYAGLQRFEPGGSRRLLFLSRGGKDAKVVREFDTDTKSFVEDGFTLPEAKSSVSAIDLDTLLVATVEGPETATTSGYPRVVKRWRRGQPFAEAVTLFTGEATDISVRPFVIKHPGETYVAISRGLSFYAEQIHLVDEAGNLRRLATPDSAQLLDIRAGLAYVQLRDPWSAGGHAFPPGGIVSVAIDDDSLASARLIFAPRADQSIEGISVEKDRVILSLIENVRGKLVALTPDGDSYSEREISIPELGVGVIAYAGANEFDPTSFATLTYSDHLRPPTQYRVHEGRGEFRLEVLKQAPPRFDASDMEVTQNWAVSRDGTKIPYYRLNKKGLKLDGTNPTVLYGYGGFEVSLTPGYGGVIGKLWLERGGVYVIANLRGGGEFGPAWHQAALKHNRQRAYDDFIAVAEDLNAHRVTSPRHLAIQGGSNGGLLTGVTMVQRPDLFNGVMIQVPLLDMVRYSKLLAGASWMAEYGDPEIPEELATILKYSPYQNVKAGARYPTPLFMTSTKDDRVHPGHARKMAARMIEMGHPVLYFENINGGHAGSANLDESIRMQALGWTYLWERLGN